MMARSMTVLSGLRSRGKPLRASSMFWRCSRGMEFHRREARPRVRGGSCFCRERGSGFFDLFSAIRRIILNKSVDNLPHFM
jgi:hypothetical protein